MTVLAMLSLKVRERSATAADVIADQARRHAAGQDVDVDAVEAALRELGQPVEAFAAACELAIRRQAALAAVDRLPAAAAKAKKAAAAIEAETRRFADLRAAHIQKVAALEAEHVAAVDVVNRGDEARRTLLDPKNVPGSLAEPFRLAVEERDAAEAAAGDVRRRIREERSKIGEAERWIAGHEHAVAPAIGPDRGLRPTPTAELDRRCEPHRLAIERSKRRLKTLDTELAAAEARCSKAGRVLAELELKVVKC